MQLSLLAGTGAVILIAIAARLRAQEKPVHLPKPVPCSPRDNVLDGTGQHSPVSVGRSRVRQFPRRPDRADGGSEPGRDPLVDCKERLKLLHKRLASLCTVHRPDTEPPLRLCREHSKDHADQPDE